MNNPQNSYLNWFRHSSPYINSHRNKTFVVCFGGEAVSHDNFQHIIHDIALLNSLGVRLVLVHGARKQINAELHQAKISTPFEDGMRITHARALPFVINAVGALRIQIEALLSMGLANSPMHGARIRVCSGNFVTARPVGVRNGKDFQHTGEVRRIDRKAINDLLDKGNIILLSCLGYSPTGEVFNLCMEDVATQTAIALEAEKLICFSKQEGVRNGANELIRELTPTQGKIVIEEHPENDADTLRGLDAACKVCEQHVNRAHLISYVEDGALIKELFTVNGSGTLISREPYEKIRRATIEDIGGILDVISPLEENGTLVKRSRELLEAEIERFTVIERDTMIIGCAALYPFDSPEKTGELACVAIHPNFRDGKRGSMLLSHIERQASRYGLNTLFVLTTQTEHWFLEHGFVKSSANELPESRKSLYNFQRNSKVFKKPVIR